MSPPKLRIVILGLSITSSWGNGHATTYRALMCELVTIVLPGPSLETTNRVSAASSDRCKISQKRSISVTLSALFWRATSTAVERKMPNSPTSAMTS